MLWIKFAWSQGRVARHTATGYHTVFHVCGNPLRTEAKDGRMPALLVENLACRRGDALLFSGLSFHLDSGQGLQITGRNGSGKTSLLRLLAGLAEPEAGRILWDGRDIRGQRERYARQMAFVGHAHAVNDDLTVAENLRVARALSGQGGGLDDETALIRVGLLRYAEEPARVLSAGQHRRLALARLLIANATLWILDEPFTALDTAAVDEVETLIGDRLGSGGMVLMTSHQPLMALRGQVEPLPLPA